MLRKKRHLPLLHGRLVYSGHPLYRVLWTTKNKNGRSAQPVPSANRRHSEANKVHRKVDWSPSKSHQREQRANTYLFEQQQFPNSPALAWEALRFSWQCPWAVWSESCSLIGYLNGQDDPSQCLRCSRKNSAEGGQNEENIKNSPGFTVLQTQLAFSPSSLKKSRSVKIAGY